MKRTITEQILLVNLRLLGFEGKEDTIKNLYLKAVIDAFSRIKTTEHLEEKIRDLLVKDLESENPIRELLESQILDLNWEKWLNISETEKARADLTFFLSGFQFVIECKTLKYADKKYLEEGIKRFIDLKYAEKDDFAGMLGFIIGGNPEKIVANLKEKVKAYHPSKDIEKWLAKTCAEHDLSFQSKHLRSNDTEIHIFHLFFDLRA